MGKAKNPPSGFWGEEGFFKPKKSYLLLLIDNVELILKTISNQHSIESQNNDQPDYDSVASDEDTDLEATVSKANRQKVR